MTQSAARGLVPTEWLLVALGVAVLIALVAAAFSLRHVP
jgi:hypothetical protein